MFEDYPDVVEVTQLREMLGGISKRLAYQLLASGEVHSVRIGRVYKIPKTSVIEYLTGEAQCRISASRSGFRWGCPFATTSGLWKLS